MFPVKIATFLRTTFSQNTSGQLLLKIYISYHEFPIPTTHAINQRLFLIFLLFIFFSSLKAFIWDSPVLFHETSNDCDVITVGDLFGRSGYGIGMPKGSPWSNDISLSILHFHESGAMEELESTWIDFGSCDKTQSTGTTLGLQHMLGMGIT